jgi:hypothetical protein
MNIRKLFLALASMAILVSCGGGGGSPGSQGGVTPPTNNPQTAIASDLIIGFDKKTLSNTGSDKVVINVTAVNSSGNALANVPVSVSVDNDAVFSGAAAPGPNGFVTDASGKFTGEITSPGNKSNRVINVTITSGNARKAETVLVVGSQITITPVPGAPFAGTATTLNLRLTDANGNGIASTDLTISGSAGFSGTVRTNNTGDAIFNGNAPSTAGTYSIEVAGSGVSISSSLTVVSQSGGGIPPAIGPVGPGSLNASPNNIPTNISASSNNRSGITFRIRNGANQGVQNVRVRFEILPPGLGAGERMSTGSAIVYTNGAGEVTSDYIPGSRSSPTDGVELRACYGLTDADLANNACPNSATTKLTVAGQALNLSIFNNNTLQGRINNTIYIQTLVVQVTDSAGNPVRDALVSATVDITHYGKGRIWDAPYLTPPIVAPTINDTYTTTLQSPSLVPTSTIITIATGTTVTGFNVWCTNEDLNRNGTRDTGEDLDGDGVLEPRKSDISISAPSGNRTDASGLLTLDVQYGQNVGGWLAYTVKAVTLVDGSEGTNSRAFITGVLEGDVRNGAFLTPPYGINSCNTNN